MKRTFVIFALIVGMCLCAGIDYEMQNAINRMIPGDVNTDALLNTIADYGQYFAANTGASQVGEFVGQNHRIDAHGVGVDFQPYQRFEPLEYVDSISGVTFENRVSTNGQGYVIARSYMGARNGNAVSMRAGVAIARGNPKQQQNAFPYQHCWGNKCNRKCENRVNYQPRGFHHHEIENMTTKLTRQASIKMRDVVNVNLGAEMFEGMPDLGDSLSGTFIGAANTLKQLYTEIIVAHSEVRNVPAHKIWNAIDSQTRGAIGDGNIRNHMNAMMAGNNLINFLVFPSQSNIIAVSATKTGASYTLGFTQFTVSGAVPVGAYTINNSGNHQVVLGGAGSAPSLHQILAHFAAVI